MKELIEQVTNAINEHGFEVIVESKDYHNSTITTMQFTYNGELLYILPLVRNSRFFLITTNTYCGKYKITFNNEFDTISLEM